MRKALYLYSSWSLHTLGLSLFFFLDCHIFKKKFSNTLLGRELGSPMSHLTLKFTLFLGRSVAFQNELFWGVFVCFVVLFCWFGVFWGWGESQSFPSFPQTAAQTNFPSG